MSRAASRKVMAPVFTTKPRGGARASVHGRADARAAPGAPESLRGRMRVFLTNSAGEVTGLRMVGQRKIGVLMGGLSAERDVSMRSGEAILGALTDRGYDAWPLFVDRDVDLVLRQARIDVAFLALHGRYGEDGCVQGMLELLG